MLLQQLDMMVYRGPRDIGQRRYQLAGRYPAVREGKLHNSQPRRIEQQFGQFRKIASINLKKWIIQFLL